MANDAYFAVSGYVATQPKVDRLDDGTCALSMRLAWTPRVMNRATGEWTDRPTSFVSVTCYRKVAENASRCLRRGDAIMLRGTLRVREFTDQAGAKRNSVDVVADSLGHDMSRGTSHYTKVNQHAEQTAEEYESSVTELNPLPGDVAARASEEPADLPHSSQQVQPAADDDPDDELDPADLPDLETGSDAELAGARS
ncbi:MAG: single-stranded DNA-binding protein [Streptosporangiaceae bacterium]